MDKTTWVNVTSLTDGMEISNSTKIQSFLADTRCTLVTSPSSKTIVGIFKYRKTMISVLILCANAVIPSFAMGLLTRFKKKAGGRIC